MAEPWLNPENWLDRWALAQLKDRYPGIPDDQLRLMWQRDTAQKMAMFTPLAALGISRARPSWLRPAPTAQAKNGGLKYQVTAERPPGQQNATPRPQTAPGEPPVATPAPGPGGTPISRPTPLPQRLNNLAVNAMTPKNAAMGLLAGGLVSDAAQPSSPVSTAALDALAHAEGGYTPPLPAPPPYQPPPKEEKSASDILNERELERIRQQGLLADWWPMMDGPQD